jgi:hypothetical protein
MLPRRDAPCSRAHSRQAPAAGTPSISKNFVKVLEQRKPKGVPRPSRRHFLRSLDPAAWFQTAFLNLPWKFRRHLDDAVMELMRVGL